MYVGILPAYMSVTHGCSAHGGQTRSSDPLRLELNVVVSLAIMWVMGSEPRLPASTTNINCFLNCMPLIPGHRR